MRLHSLVPLLVFAVATANAQATDNTSKYKQSTGGVRDFMIGATAVKVLIDSATLGGSEMEMARLTFPPANPAAPARAHVHGHVEVLYILSGELDHIVNGVSHPLKAGMAGIVRPGDQVTHKVLSSDSVRVLVIWAPGSELARIAPPE